ncbi:hypothetical protein [Chlorobium sp. N1]|uniref:hypothetical protein n=1 Tax=Chlorobium sp. N1 TaxID=2491138 RepID=UPI00103C0DD8|nr:hypothetical protein [Chlorobium sp. N1]TCD46848.1 hypothetical protein E0L29_11205 [Chlorobium sp. N1]
MSVREFELYHGAVLAKILRSDKPVALRLVETKPGENWSTYTLNDAVSLLVTFSKGPRPISRGNGGISWSFVFSVNQLRQMNPDNSELPVWVAMVCGRKSPADGDMQVCLLDPEQLADVIDFTAAQQSLTVRNPKGRGQLRVFKGRKETFLVPQSRLEKWELPGS